MFFIWYNLICDKKTSCICIKYNLFVKNFLKNLSLKVDKHKKIVYTYITIEHWGSDSKTDKTIFQIIMKKLSKMCVFLQNNRFISFKYFGIYLV